MSAVWGWSKVDCLDGGAPCQRSLHAAAVLKDSIYIFGGYDGSNRVNDFFEFNIPTRVWSHVRASGTPPSPRDRHTGVVYSNSFYILAGFDGSNRVNDFFEFNFSTMQWMPLLGLYGTPPSPRHSHAAVVHRSCMFVFGGYDGSYRCDFHEFDFLNHGWSVVNAAGRVPKARYRATCVVHGGCMYLFGGHDGTRHLNDVHVFDFEPRFWMTLSTEGTPPIPRDSHVSVIHGQSMYVFGGSTGSAMNDFHELKLDKCHWRNVQALGSAPNQRFCHVACVHKDSMFVFGGYDGTSRLNDLVEFRFSIDLMSCDIPPSTLIGNLRDMVNSELLSDVTFVGLLSFLNEKGKNDQVTVEQHRAILEYVQSSLGKVLCMRCTYFRAMLTGEMKESRAKTITLPDVRRPIFLALLEYLYTDEVDVGLDVAMELFQAADQFGVERLKRMCESTMLASINVDNAASIFHAADERNAKSLREKCLNFILGNFDAVTKTPDFEEMGRTNIELVFEILRNR